MITHSSEKGQKNTILGIVILFFLLLILFNWKSCRPTISMQEPIYDSYAIDTITLKLTKQNELNALYLKRIYELEKDMDSLKESIGENNNKLMLLAKRKKDERDFNYNTWDNNEFTKFLSNRYSQ